MESADGKRNLIKWLVAASYLLMIAVNGLANYLPINGVQTGQVSDSYQNLFAPAGFTFAIWGVIYFLLAGFVVYQFGFMRTENKVIKSGLVTKIGFLFIITSVINALWVFAWHYDFIFLSLVLIALLLIFLILINLEIRKHSLRRIEKWLIRLPFSVYFGWLTIATIANTTVWLVSIGWGGFGLSEVTWTVIILAVGLLISASTMVRFKDIAYGLVIIWAYYGILMKHLSPDGFGFNYPAIVITVITCMILLAAVEVYLVLAGRRSSKQAVPEMDTDAY